MLELHPLAMRWRRDIVGAAWQAHGESCDGRALATCYASEALAA